MKQPTTVENMPSPVPAGSIDTNTLGLLARWKAEDATQDPDAIRAAEREVSEFKNSINENRTGRGGRTLSS